MSNESVSLPTAFGAWQFSHIQDTPGISFDLTTPGEVPVWRSELPSDLGVAADQLSEEETLTQDSFTTLNGIPDRIDSLVRQAQMASSAGLSFDATGLDALQEADTELLSMVETINSPSVGVSFAAGGVESSKIESTYREFKEDMERLLRLVAHFAWVETELGGEILARSIVSWTGDLDTDWASRLQDEAYQLHKRSLAQALATRNIAVHAISITAQSAVKLSLLLATPGGNLLAVPLVWKYVKQILADVQKYKQIIKVPV